MKSASKTRRRSPALPELTARLRQGAVKVTGPRQAILEILRQQARPMAIKEIYVALAGGGCDLATVYRSIRLLERMGMVKRFDFGDGGARFELIAEGEDGHHHYLVCVRCTDMIEIGECLLRGLDERVGSTNGFKAVTHKLEFSGLCPRCQR